MLLTFFALASCQSLATRRVKRSEGTCSGITRKGNTAWKQYVYDNSVYVDVDTSACGFSEKPSYVSSIGGGVSSPHSAVFGSSEIYEARKDRFRVYVYATGITPDKANDWKWHVNWVAHPIRASLKSCAGETEAGSTPWQNYGNNG